MRANVVEDHFRTMRGPSVPCVIYWLKPENEGDGSESDAGPSRPGPLEHEELPYKVELWDAAKTAVEQVLAVTASGSIGYAAFYAATREFADRFVTLRHRNSIISRWNGPRH